MPLPDADRLLDLDPARLRAFGRRLRDIGFDTALLAKLARAGERLDDVLRAPMRIWHARRMAEPGAIAGRLFMLHDAVSEEEAAAALGDLSPLLAAGLVEEAADGLVSRFKVGLCAGLLCFGDKLGQGPGAVLPLTGPTIELVRAAMPRASPVKSALDVGCGAGAVGLALARAARRVVATDILPRALAFVRFNAALNGIDNVEPRLGDALAPVAGERFDRIAVQPPFLACPSGQEASVFVHGGERGDELAVRVLAALPPYLAEGGRAVMLTEWPLADGDAVEARIRAALGEACANVLLLQAPTKNLDEHCVQLAAAEHPTLDAAFTRDAIRHRDHLERLGVRGLALGLVVLEPSASTGWTSRLAVRHMHDVPIDAVALERVLAAHALAHAPDDVLARAKLCFPGGGQRVVQEMPGGGSSWIVHPPPGRPEWPAVFTAEEGAVLSAIAHADRTAGTKTSASGREVLAVARKALRCGALETG